MREYEQWKLAMEPDSDEYQNLRSGTRTIYRTCKTKPSKLPIGRIISAVFSLMSLNSFANQITIAFKWMGTLPLLSLIIFAKELFGLICVIKPTFGIIKKKPGKRYFEALLDPFNKEYGFLSFINISDNLKNFLRPLLFCIITMSNGTACVFMALCSYLDCSLPILGESTALQKVGNIMVLVFDLVVKTSNENPAVNAWLFRSLIVSIFFMVFSHFGQSSTMLSYYDWIADVDDGKVTPDGVRIGLEDIYKGLTGEPAPKKFAESALGCSKKPEAEKSENKKLD